MVDSLFCLDPVVPEGIRQVWRRLEVGDHKRRTLNTRLSSGTSAGTFACLAGFYRNYTGESDTKKRTKMVFCTRSKEGSDHRSSRFEPKILWISFSRGSGPPLLGIMYRIWDSTSIFNSELLGTQRHPRRARPFHSVCVRIDVCMYVYSMCVCVSVSCAHLGAREVIMNLLVFTLETTPSL